MCSGVRGTVNALRWRIGRMVVMCDSTGTGPGMVRRLHFAKLNPSGNTTVIVLDPLERELYAEVAKQLMGPEGLGADQVGFVGEAKDPKALGRLNMMGGEFCGNAARAYAAYLAFIRHPSLTWHDGQAEVPIEISGYDGVLLPRISAINHETASAHVISPMPIPNQVHFVDFGSDKLGLVNFEGISHAVAWEVSPSEDAFNEIASMYSRPDDAAFGVMFFSEEDSKIVPLVLVRDTGSLVWEGSCASGAVAVACAVASRDRRSTELRLSQPAGVLHVKVTWNEDISGAAVGGQVDMIACGSVFVRLPAFCRRT